MKKIYNGLIIVLIPFILSGQDITVSQGISISIAFPKKLRVMVSYDIHVRSHIKIVDEFVATPFADLKVSLFSHHVGSSILKKYRPPVYSNIAISYGGLVSYEYRKHGEEGLVPVFSSVYHNVLNNDMKYNLGFGSTHSVQYAMTGNKDPYDKTLNQKVGSLMLSVDGFYMNYYNDGGPILNYFGDGEDRYWTGGLTLGYLLKSNGELHQLEIAFDKFTGWTKYAFEATGLLNVDNVLYSSIEQFSYNTGRLGLKYVNHSLGFGFSTNIWNIPFDLQDYIHRDISNNPFHHKIEKLYIDIEAYKIYKL